MDEINVGNMNEKLVEAIPELRERYEEEVNWWGDEVPPNHVLYGDVLCPYLESLLKAENQDNALKNIFSFLEKLAGSNDEGVVNVLNVTVFEYIMFEKTIWEKARTFMGPTTLKLSYEMEKYLEEISEAIRKGLPR